MADNDYPETQLYDFVMTESAITCDFCKETDTIDDDGDAAIDHWYHEGWRGRTKCYCPKCAKKKLKKGA